VRLSFLLQRTFPGGMFSELQFKQTDNYLRVLKKLCSIQA